MYNQNFPSCSTEVENATAFAGRDLNNNKKYNLFSSVHDSNVILF